MATTCLPEVSDAELLEKNRIYDRASDLIWRRVVYGPVHDGWEFTNMGGRHILDYVGQCASVSGGRVVELCSGLGDTCRYLASNFNCHVTGVEMNRQQFENASERVSRDPELSERIDFVLSDVRSWQPASSFDVAFSLDSLMLVNGVQEILTKVHSVLKPGGVVVLTELTSGPNVTKELLEFVWKLDGMITVPTPVDYEAMLIDAGFIGIEIVDVTALALDCFERMSTTMQEQRDELLEVIDGGEYESWERLTKFYCDCFRNQQFTYSRITAHR
jgi:cyclopropane fatty-acyl-phospholipid synthase-like methyltransferase